MKSPRRQSRHDQPLLLRYPRAVLAVAAAFLIVLGAIGIGVEDRLDPTTLDVPGTKSLEGNEILRAHFGPSAPFAILLQAIWFVPTTLVGGGLLASRGVRRMAASERLRRSGSESAS